ncbi:hypothetical protein [Chromohalobacter sp. 296-RDG]|uniref:DUF968 domain-containing protein n=1 Tax=Chromohalobacter sp. 296-RDG TaxID=2994062 RepID=UPI002468B86F|nr:hypothetical protein [Chromohalobacter sp. 296-RDG]
MKRTGPIGRKTPLRAKAPMNRKRERRTAPKRKASTDTRWRSPVYLAWVRSLPCCVCDGPADSAHHLIGMYQIGGMGLKAPDSLCMPVCDGPGGCHARIHAEKNLRDMQPAWLRRTIALGMREFDGETREALNEALEFINDKEEAA